MNIFKTIFNYLPKNTVFKIILIISGASIILLALLILFNFNIIGSEANLANANFYKLLSLVVSSVVSYFITSLFLNRIKISKDKLNRILHNSIIVYIVIIVAFLFLNYLHIIPEVYCDGIDDDIITNEQHSQAPASDNINNENNIIEKASLKNEQTKDGNVYNLSVSFNDSDVESLTRAGKTFVETIIPSIGAGTAGASAAAAMIKATPHLPPLQRTAMVGSVAFAAATATTFGMKAGSALAKNIKLDSFNSKSSYSNPNVDSPTIIPSPTSPISPNSPTITPNPSPTSPNSPTITPNPTSPNNPTNPTSPSPSPTSPNSPNSPTSPDSPNDFMINSPLEANENITPLDTLLECMLVFNILELFLIAILLLILFNRYIYKLNIEITTKLVNKYMPNTFISWYTNNIPRSIEYNNKFTTFMFIITSILLILIKLGNIYISAELSINTDNFVQVYNYLKSINK